MSIIVSVRGDNISDTAKSYTEKKVAVILDEYDKITSIRVVLSSEKARYSAEILVIGKNINLEAKQEKYDIYEAIDTALDKILTQLRRYIDKVQDKSKYRKDIDSESFNNE